MGRPTNKERGLPGKKAHELTVDFSGYVRGGVFPDDSTVAYLAVEEEKKMSNLSFKGSFASYLAAYRVVRNELEIKKNPKVTFVVIDNRLTTTFQVQLLQKLLLHDMLDAGVRGVVYNQDPRFENTKLSPRGESPTIALGFFEPIVFDDQFIEFNSPHFTTEILTAITGVESLNSPTEKKQNIQVLLSDTATKVNDVVSTFSEKYIFSQSVITFIKDFANITSISEKKREYEKFKLINKHLASKGDIIMAASEASYSVAVTSLKIAIGSKIIKSEIKTKLKRILSDIEKKVSSKVVFLVEGINIVKSVVLLLEGKSAFQSIEAISISVVKIRVAASLMTKGAMLKILVVYYSSKLVIHTMNEIGKVPSYFVSAKYFDNLKLIINNFKKVTSKYLVFMYVNENLLSIVGLPRTWGEEQKEIYARKLQILYESIKHFESLIPKNEITSKVFISQASELYKKHRFEINNYGTDYSYLNNEPEWDRYRKWVIGYYDLYFKAVIRLYTNSNDYIKEETTRVIQKN